MCTHKINEENKEISKIYLKSSLYLKPIGYILTYKYIYLGIFRCLNCITLYLLSAHVTFE